MRGAWRAVFPIALATLAVSACVATRGGWDVDRLVELEPALATVSGHRLGDTLPFPALDGDHVALLLCHFPTDRAIEVAGEGPDLPIEWTEAAVRAVDASVGRLAVELVSGAGRPGARPPEIVIVSVAGIDAEEPGGLGDTISECDVSPVLDAPGDHRGVLVRAEIRMRRARRDQVGRMRDAAPEEWVGALMHELAHALGFPGHAATGQTVLVREQSELRRAGRRALAGESRPDPTLDALYLVEPGQRVGSREIDSGDLVWVRVIEALGRRRAERGQDPLQSFATVGDVGARIVWRDSEGSEWTLQLPRWRSELLAGKSITLVPDAAIRALAAAATVNESGR